MIHRFLLCTILFALVVSHPASPQPEESNAGSSKAGSSNYDLTGESWEWSSGSEEGGGSFPPIGSEN